MLFSWVVCIANVRYSAFSSKVFIEKRKKFPCNTLGGEKWLFPLTSKMSYKFLGVFLSSCFHKWHHHLKYSGSDSVSKGCFQWVPIYKELVDSAHGHAGVYTRALPHTHTRFPLQESYSSDNQSYVHNAAAKLSLVDELLNQQRGF